MHFFEFFSSLVLVLAGPVWGAYAVDLAGINLIAHSIAPLLLVTVLVSFCVLRDLVDSSTIAMTGGGGTVDEEAGAGQVRFCQFCPKCAHIVHRVAPSMSLRFVHFGCIGLVLIVS